MGDPFVVATFALAAITTILLWVVWRNAMAAAAARAVLKATIETPATRTPHEMVEARAMVNAVRDAGAAATGRFQLMADNVPVLIWISGTDKGCTWCNRPWLDFTGRPLELQLGEGWHENVHPDDRRRCIDTYGAAFDARVPITMEYRLRRHDDDYRWMLCNGVPLHDERTDFVGYLSCCVDLTDRRRVEQERLDLLERAETANRLKDEFLATLSHELRTPLNTVLGWTHLLKVGGLKDQSEISNALDIIERNVRVQSKLVEDVLDISRIVSGKLRLDLQHLDIANVVLGAINVLQPTASAKGVALEVDVRQGHGFVAGDPARLHQAIWNVVSNAIKFTRPGGSVDVRVGRSQGYVDVTVADTGIGIPAEFLPHVFERFRQAEGGYAREYGGLGLGLAIVRHLVELHGGSVSVHSPGRDLGATFRLRFPLVAIHPSVDATIETPALIPQVAGVRVLVVDDDPDALRLIARILESGGAVVKTAESAFDALTALDEGEFDVLLSDLAMPIEDGCDLMHKVRQRSAARGGEIAAAAVTAYARPEDRARVLLAGFQLHLAKPIDPGELLAVVKTLAAKKPIDPPIDETSQGHAS